MKGEMNFLGGRIGRECNYIIWHFWLLRYQTNWNITIQTSLQRMQHKERKINNNNNNNKTKNNGPTTKKNNNQKKKKKTYNYNKRNAASKNNKDSNIVKKNDHINNINNNRSVAQLHRRNAPCLWSLIFVWLTAEDLLQVSLVCRVST